MPKGRGWEVNCVQIKIIMKTWKAEFNVKTSEKIKFREISCVCWVMQTKLCSKDWLRKSRNRQRKEFLKFVERDLMALENHCCTTANNIKKYFQFNWYFIMFNKNITTADVLLCAEISFSCKRRDIFWNIIEKPLNVTLIPLLWKTRRSSKTIKKKIHKIWETKYYKDIWNEKRVIIRETHKNFLNKTILKLHKVYALCVWNVIFLKISWSLLEKHIFWKKKLSPILPKNVFLCFSQMFN